MPAKRGGGASISGSEGVAPSDSDLAQVTPKDLYPTSDIRFVLVELGKIGRSIEALDAQSKNQDSKLDDIRDRIQTAKDEVNNKIHTLEKELHGFKIGAIVAGTIISAAAFGFWFLEGERITNLLKGPAANVSVEAPSTLLQPPAK